MKRILTLLIFSSLFLIVSATMKAQTPMQPGGAEAKDVDYNNQPQQAQPPAVDDTGTVAEQPGGSYNLSLQAQVDPNLQLDQATQQLYQQAANILNGSQFVPQQRTNYFSAYTNSNTVNISGWVANVESVVQNDTGYAVTVAVVPGIDCADAGPATLMFGSNYLEVYQISNNQATYISSQDPDGTAGGQFTLMGF